MVVLFSLILSLGMLVDNAIVVVENIYRYLEEGYDNFEAAKKGTGEVALPIITGTFTTIAAFAPMVFWPGITGEFMSYLPKTLIITLGSSLFVGLIINPVICALFMKVEHDANRKVSLSHTGKVIASVVGGLFALILIATNPITWTMLFLMALILWGINRVFLNPIGRWWQLTGLHSVIDVYELTIRWALKRWALVAFLFAPVAFFFAIALLVVFPVGVEFFPENIPPRDVYVQVEAPVGSDVDFTKEIVDEIRNEIPYMIDNQDDINSVLATSGAAISADMDGGGGNSTHMGTVALNFRDFQQREGDVFAYMESMRNALSGKIVGAEIAVEKPADGPPTGKPINLEISGPDMDQLTLASSDILRILEEDSIYIKLDGLESDLPKARPEIRVTVDREKAALYELNTNSIGFTIRQAINGVEASKFRDGKEEYDIIVRLSDEYRDDMSTLGDLTIFHEGTQIPLSEVASWEVSDGLGGIKHKESERVITISADVRAGIDDNANAVLAEAQEVLGDYLEGMPPGYSYSWTGQQQEQDESFDFLGRAFIIAVFLIAFILVSQFNSVVKPLIILSSVIMSTAGVFYGLVMFQMAFGLMAFLGVISLAGVVVNNAIVLIDYVDILRTRDGLGLKEALIQAGKVRFRPVILTAVTTTLGLVPLAVGFNFDFIVLVGSPLEFFTNLGDYIYMGGEQAAWWGPMAIAVIVGLLFATALTLILVPVLYFIFERASVRLKELMYNQEEEIKSPEINYQAPEAVST
jgi:multidrug efflux pump subunit AcrB